MIQGDDGEYLMPVKDFKLRLSNGEVIDIPAQVAWVKKVDTKDGTWFEVGGYLFPDQGEELNGTY